MFAIEVSNLTKKFGKFISVKNVSFNVKSGEIFGFLGANGAGKSTTIRMLCGIMQPTSGDAMVAGYSVYKEPEMVKKNIGYMSQKFSLYNDLTIEENINFFGGVYGLDNNKLAERKKWVLKVANLEGKEKQLTKDLPVGIKQRLALGTSLVHEPKIVFLDEPTGGVDPISRRNFWDLINDLSANGTTVFVTTHYLDEAEFCNNIVLINAGEIIAQGSAKELKNNYLEYPIYEIECDRPIDLMGILSEQAYVVDTTIFGNNIHIAVNDLSVSGNTLRETIKNSFGIETKRIDRITPTLEDVFIHLLDKDKKDVK